MLKTPDFRVQFGQISAEYDPESEHVTLGAGGHYVTIGGDHLMGLITWLRDEVYGGDELAKPALITDLPPYSPSLGCEGDEYPTEENTAPERFARIGDLTPKLPPKEGE